MNRDELREGLLGLVSLPTIDKKLDLLEELGMVLSLDIPNPRYNFDRRKSYLFRPWRVCQLHKEKTGQALDCPIHLYEKLNDPAFFEDQEVIEFIGKICDNSPLLKSLQCIVKNFTVDSKKFYADCKVFYAESKKVNPLYNRSNIDLKEKEVAARKTIAAVPESLILDELTNLQQSDLKKCFLRKKLELGNYNEEIWLDALAIELTNPQSYLDGKQNFKHKLNILLSEIRKGEWSPDEYVQNKKLKEVKFENSIKASLSQERTGIISKMLNAKKMITLRRDYDDIDGWIKQLQEAEQALTEFDKRFKEASTHKQKEDG
jgi:hypothetical protein